MQQPKNFETTSGDNSESTATQEQPPPTDTPGLNLAKKFGRLHLAGNAAGLAANVEANDLSNKWGDRHAAANHDLLYGDRGKDLTEGDGMGTHLNLGDTVHNPAPIIIQQPEQKQGMSTLAKLGTAAAFGVGGPLAGVAATLGFQLWDRLQELETKPDPVPVVQPVDAADTDTNTIRTIRLRKGDPSK